VISLEPKAGGQSNGSSIQGTLYTVAISCSITFMIALLL
jgi:hypothetical protein